MIRGRHLNVVERMIRASISATRSRHAIPTVNDRATKISLQRAADHYSRQIAELADELLASRGQ